MKPHDFRHAGDKSGYKIVCDSCGQTSYVPGDHGRYCPICGRDTFTPIAVEKIVPEEENVIRRSKMKDEKKETAINWIVCQDGDLFRVNGTASEMKQILAGMARLDARTNKDFQEFWTCGTTSVSEVSEIEGELRAYNYYEYEGENGHNSWQDFFVAVPEKSPVPAKILLDNIYTGADMDSIPRDLYDKLCDALTEYDPEDANRGDVLYDLLKAVVKYA